MKNQAIHTSIFSRVLYRSFVISAIAMSANGYAQHSAVNEVRKTVMLSPTPMGSQPADADVEAIFFDGLGRKVQSLNFSMSAGNVHIPSAGFSVYDSRGRVVQEWLPVKLPSGTNGFSTLEAVRESYGSSDDKAFAFSEFLYESAPQGRLVCARRPGAALHDPAVSPRVTSYGWNSTADASLNVKKLIQSGSAIVNLGNLRDNHLSVVSVCDEDGNRKSVFSDIEGNTVLSRECFADGRTYDTYTAYDRFGRPIALLSPKTMELIASGGGIEATSENGMELMKSFSYDKFGRVAAAYGGGAGYSRFVYSRDGLLCFSQSQRQADCGEVSYFAYDRLGRKVLSGVAALNGRPWSFIEAQSPRRVSFSPAADNTVMGYVKGLGCESEQSLLSADFYDSYDFLAVVPDSVATMLQWSNEPGCDLRGDMNGSAAGFSPKGHLTGSARRIIDENGDGGWIFSAFYYDRKGRLIQSRATNHLGGVDVSSLALEFDGRVRRSVTMHSSADTTVTVNRLFDYSFDPGQNQRVCSTLASIDDGETVTLSTQRFDPLGRQVSVELLDNNTIMGYEYDLEGNIEQVVSPAFVQTLYRTKRLDGSGGFFNGRIASEDFLILNNASSPDKLCGVAGTYDYFYSGPFLAKAQYTELTRLWSAADRSDGVVARRWTEPDYSCSYSCDLDGNLTKIKRNGPKLYSRSGNQRDRLTEEFEFGCIDDLSLSYSGNRLVKVADAAEDVDVPGSLDFDDGEDKSVEYSYDGSGNLTADLNRKVSSISYNVLGLPSKVRFSNNREIRYGYDSDGNRLWTCYGRVEYFSILPMPGGQVEPSQYFRQNLRRDNCGCFLYVDNRLERILHEAGWSTDKNTHTAVIRDYRGSLRATLTCNFALESRESFDPVTGDPVALPTPDIRVYENLTGYYPYGMPWADWQGEERFLFEGKELEREYGYGRYDFHARQLDFATGRMDAQDTFRNSFPHLSPYLYCASDPVNHTDPTGNKIEGTSMEKWDFNKKALKERLKDFEYLSFVDKNPTINIDDGIREQIQQRSYLRKVESAILQAEKSEIHTFRLIEKDDVGDVRYNPQDNVIEINYMGDDNFVHEVMHISQFFSGDLAFGMESGGALAHDLYDEVEAYKAQYSYNSTNFNTIKSNTVINSINDITSDWVSNITYNGQFLYRTDFISATPTSIYTPYFMYIPKYPKLNFSLLKYFRDLEHRRDVYHKNSDFRKK